MITFLYRAYDAQGEEWSRVVDGVS
jgi:hypothetical protein